MNCAFLSVTKWLTFLIVICLTIPLLLLADTPNEGGGGGGGGGCGTSGDNDCDGYLNHVPDNCAVCSNFDVDMDDHDADVPSAIGMINA